MLIGGFFFNDTATTEIYTLSLHDALPIFQLDLAVRDDVVDWLGHLDSSGPPPPAPPPDAGEGSKLPLPLGEGRGEGVQTIGDRKSTRLNSSHANISYAGFCLKKKNNNE